MGMKHDLPAEAVDVHCYAVTLEAMLGSNLSGDEHQLAEQGIIGIIEFIQRRHVTFRNDESVHGRLGVKVPEREHVVILIELVALELAGNDSAKDAIALI